MRDFDKQIEETIIKNKIADYKQKLKEPYIRRRALLLRLCDDYELRDVKQSIMGLDTETDLKIVDEKIEAITIEYDEARRQINDYYYAKFKAIDEAKVKVTKKNP